jgi:hypothetical protein
MEGNLARKRGGTEALFPSDAEVEYTKDGDVKGQRLAFKKQKMLGGY